MSEKIECPNCHSYKIKKKIRDETIGLGRGKPIPGDTRKERFISYQCLNCGKEFDQDYLLSKDMDEDSF